MINNKPKVSIIVPVYNVENYLARCLDSLINQSFNDIEIICINDGSTDRSLDILKEYEIKDSRVKIIDKENSGVSNCRNKGINLVNGEYIVFVDSDDWINIDMLKTMYNKATENNSDIVMCSYMREFINHSKEKVFDLPKEVVYEKEEIKNKLHRKLFGPIDSELGNPEGLDALGTIWAKLYRTSIIKDNNIEFIDLKEIGSNEDSLFNIFAFKYINKITFINKPFYHYWRGNPNSLTSRYNPNLKKQWNVLFEYMYKFIDENNLDASFYKALENRICMCVLGLGLNECSKLNKLPLTKKIKNIKSILNEKLIKNAYKKFNIKKFPIHWRVFYIFNKNRLAVPSYFMISTIEFLRTRV